MKNEREELLKCIMAFDFAAIEMNLYLDTHPFDMCAINLHNYYVTHGKALRDQYERLYGPITANSPHSRYPWKWIESPWPWEQQ